MLLNRQLVSKIINVPSEKLKQLSQIDSVNLTDATSYSEPLNKYGALFINSWESTIAILVYLLSGLNLSVLDFSCGALTKVGYGSVL